MDVVQAINLAISCTFIGILLRDWSVRTYILKATKAARDEALVLVTEYKSILQKINDLDTDRTKALITLTQRVEALEMRANLGAKK